jgi:hypothetical protein
MQPEVPVEAVSPVSQRPSGNLESRVWSASTGREHESARLVRLRLPCLQTLRKFRWNGNLSLTVVLGTKGLAVALYVNYRTPAAWER